MTKMFKCLGCGSIQSIATAVAGRFNPRSFVNEDGEPIGCAFCGSTDYAPILEQLPPEESPKHD